MEQQVSRLTLDKKHVDQYGHINYKAIPALLEPFQDEFMERQNASFDLIEREHGLRSFVKKMEITWHRELKEGETCTVITRMELGNTSMKFFQEIHVFNELAVVFLMIVVVVDGDGKSTPLPEHLRQRLS